MWNDDKRTFLKGVHSGTMDEMNELVHHGFK